MPTVRDRVGQQALVRRLEPIFEPQRRDGSLGERAGRSPHMAMRNVWRERPAGHVWIVDADVRQYLDTSDQATLSDVMAEEISDGRGRP